MGARIARWLRVGAILCAVLLAFTYGADWLLFRMEGSPKSQFTVSHFSSAPLKNNKQEIDYLGSEPETCSISLFPQEGFTPCWYLRRHLNQVITY